MLAHEQGIERMRRIVVGEDAQGVVSELLIELYGSLVINCRFQVDLGASSSSQPSFTLLQETKTEAGPTGLGHDVQGENAADFAARLRYHETGDGRARISAIRGAGKFRNEGDSVAPTYEAGQVHLGESDAGRET